MKVEELFEKRGLWDNIHAKRKRIKAGSGEKMRKPGSKGAPSEKDLKDSQVDEGKAGVAVAQPKETISKLRKSGTMMPKGHFHKKGEDWESTEVTKPKGKK